MVQYFYYQKKPLPHEALDTYKQSINELMLYITIGENLLTSIRFWQSMQKGPLIEFDTILKCSAFLEPDQTFVTVIKIFEHLFSFKFFSSLAIFNHI